MAAAIACNSCFPYMRNLVNGGMALPAIRLSMGRFQVAFFIYMKDLKSCRLFRPGKAGILMAGKASAFIHGKSHLFPPRRKQQKNGHRRHQTIKFLWFHLYSPSDLTSPVRYRRLSNTWSFHSRRLFPAPEINDRRQIKRLVFINHPHKLTGDQVINPLPGKSEFLKVQIAIFFVAIGTGHRLF